MAVFVMAELGLNHNGDVHTGHKLIDAAAVAGADAVKFQLISAEAGYNVSPTSPLREIIAQCDLSDCQFKELVDYARERGLEAWSSVADLPSVERFRQIDFDGVKISSSNFTNRPLHEDALQLNKPLLISAGGYSLATIAETVEFMKRRCASFGLFHCIPQYPAKESDCCLDVIRYFRQTFSIDVGFSDHTASVIAGCVAVAKGATYIEKHLTLCRDLDGPDHKASIEPEMFKDYVRNIRSAEVMKGNAVRYYFEDKSHQNPAISRTIIAKETLEIGTVLTPVNIIVARPKKYSDDCVDPKFIKQLYGKVVQRKIEEWQPVSWENLLENSEKGNKDCI